MLEPPTLTGLPTARSPEDDHDLGCSLYDWGSWPRFAKPQTRERNLLTPSSCFHQTCPRAAVPGTSLRLKHMA